MAQARLCRRHRHLLERGHRDPGCEDAPEVGAGHVASYRQQSARRAGDLIYQQRPHRAPAPRWAGLESLTMSVTSDKLAGEDAANLAVKRAERRAGAVACGAHALHDGYTDLIYV